MNAISALALLFSLCCLSLSEAFSTYLVEERSEVCFFRYVESKTSLHAKVFVFEGGAKLDIGFSVRGPMQLDSKGDVISSGRSAKLHVRHFAKVSSEGFIGNKEEAEFSGYEHRFDAEKGEYEICLTNDRRFEQVAKHVMLDISEVVEGEDDSTAQHSTDSQDPKQKDLVEVQKGMRALREIFENIEHSQDQERMRLTQRKMAAEYNHWSMVQSSVMETIVLLVVGVGQIFFVRKWFSGKGNILKQWA